MEQSRAAQIAEPTPIFGGYRRGYDPDQVDQYVAEQQRRLDGAEHRASDAERKLAAAIGQLRELHRRVGVLEENREQSGPPVRIDGVGEHIQRMFEEARQGAEALRSSTEIELAGLREKTIGEARSILAGARKKSEEIEADTERRRREQLDRLEEERIRASAQLSFVHERRKNAISELVRLRELIDSTIAEVSADLRPHDDTPADQSSSPRVAAARTEEPRLRTPMRDPAGHQTRSSTYAQRLVRPPTTTDPRDFVATGESGFETARLVRDHRAKIGTTSGTRRARVPAEPRVERRSAFSVFDYEAH